MADQKTCQNCIWLNNTFRNTRKCPTNDVTPQSPACKQYLSITPDVAHAVEVLNSCTDDQVLALSEVNKIYVRHVKAARKKKRIEETEVIELALGDLVQGPDMAGSGIVRGRVFSIARTSCRIMDEQGICSKLRRLDGTLEMVQPKAEQRFDSNPEPDQGQNESDPDPDGTASTKPAPAFEGDEDETMVSR